MPVYIVCIIFLIHHLQYKLLGFCGLNTSKGVYYIDVSIYLLLRRIHEK